MNRYKLNSLLPATITFLIASLLLSLALLSFGGDALSLARLGTRFSLGDAQGTSGYDGQFVYYIARDLNPVGVSKYLDAPAYRYQRILMPLLARILSAGYLPALPWVLLLLGISSHVIGTWAVGEYLHAWGVNRWFSLVYGLWVGFLLALIVDLPEPMAYGFIATGWLARHKHHYVISWLLFGLALFTKEVSVLFVAAVWFNDLLKKHWSEFLGMSLVTIIPYGIFQLWLRVVFGQFGIASGGDLATPFEWIPFMGLWRMGSSSWIYMLGMLVVFGPAILLPVVWGIGSSVRKIILSEYDETSLALLLNGLAIVFLPFSTFRETGGLLRFACGLVLAVVLFSSRYQLKRVMNYCVLWLVLNVFLLKP